MKKYQKPKMKSSSRSSKRTSEIHSIDKEINNIPSHVIPNKAEYEGALENMELDHAQGMTIQNTVKSSLEGAKELTSKGDQSYAKADFMAIRTFLKRHR
jgi:hypothetical protein